MSAAEKFMTFKVTVAASPTFNCGSGFFKEIFAGGRGFGLVELEDDFVEDFVEDFAEDFVEDFAEED